MKKIAPFFWSVIFLSSASGAFAAADFYGVKMTSEYHSKDLIVDESGPSPQFSVDKPGMDKRISATAHLAGRHIKIQVSNRSDETIRSERDFSEFIVVTHDGERTVLNPRPAAWSSDIVIAPKKNASFEPSFYGRSLKKSEIRAIICSFDLGEIKIILLPLKDTPPASVAPAAKAAKPVDKIAPPKSKEKPAPKKEAPKKIEEKKPVVLQPKKEKKVPPPASAKADPSSGGKGGSASGGKKSEAPKPKIEEKKSIPAPKKGGSSKPKIAAKPALPAPEIKKTASPVQPKKDIAEPSAKEIKLLDQYEKSRKSRKYWHVEEVREDLAVINLGAGDGLKPGASVQIARDGAFVAQAQVRQVSSGYATVSLPQEAAVKTDDDVLFFGAAV